MLALFTASIGNTAPIAPPPEGKLYQGFYYDGMGSDTHDPTEHDFTPADVHQYQRIAGAKTAWIYFSDNWFESRAFPDAICRSIRDLGKIPFLRLMLRSSVEQSRVEKTFTIKRINDGEFDHDLRAWAQGAKAFGSPILIEWGTEPNGKWFSWNGKWNGGLHSGPANYIRAHRHIVDIVRSEGADNLQWVWHVNWDDDPEQHWNAFENYFPGQEYCDWIALSIYGPLTPMTRDGCESFHEKMSAAYPRLIKVAAGKPIIVAEFGCALHNKHCDAAEWACAALDEIFSGRWPAIIGFCWWNEGWQNDDNSKHDTDMIIWHDAALAHVFHEQLAQHSGKIVSPPPPP
ncbi:MAG: beta-mannanase [Chthoniobacterales bacterium]|nr:MAG: beta-mannanase [Chthoniobacterales bacterium]